ncbi:MAG: hypothetical protein IJU23_00575 [Proteobacteria bacterium]|nr:hypothetical protein [Pseudomonadota bacterium]
MIKRIVQMCGLAAVVLFAFGCERHMSGDEPPLRPLIYTELPPGAVEAPEIAAETLINIAPEDLGYALFHALVEHDRESYESMFISGDELSALIHMKLEDASKQSSDILKKSELLWRLFSPVLESEEPIGGLSTRLRLSEFRLGKGRNLAGKIAQPEVDEVIQHWGNELRIELLGTEKIFTIRVPKIVQTPKGWRIAQPVELDKTLQLFLESGMHLKTDLLTSEHYPMPLEVGNYWKYRVEKTVGETLIQPEAGQEVTVTDMITDIIHKQGYWIVTFERTLQDPSKDDEEGQEITHFSWLATPHLILPCYRDCRNNADNIGYLLGYISRQTPIFLFPIEVGQKWDTAGQKGNFYRYEVRARHETPIVVPGGAFSGAYEIFGSIEEGRESRFFVPGTGIVMRQVRSGAGQKREVLIRHRLIL